MKKYLVSYNFEGARWSLTIPAESHSEAERRLALLGYGTVDGELMATIPGWAAPFGKVFVALKNLWRQP